MKKTLLAASLLLLTSTSSALVITPSYEGYSDIPKSELNLSGEVYQKIKRLQSQWKKSLMQGMTTYEKTDTWNYGSHNYLISQLQTLVGDFNRLTRINQSEIQNLQVQFMSFIGRQDESFEDTKIDLKVVSSQLLDGAEELSNPSPLNTVVVGKLLEMLALMEKEYNKSYPTKYKVGLSFY